MTNKMLVESDPHQTRIAVLEDDRLTEIFVERHRHRGLVGNVYKGRVTRVLPGMQAAFVDIGLERDAFLYVSDVGTERRRARGARERRGRGATSRRPPASHAPPRRRSTSCCAPGQEILVQVIKDPLPDKGARVTTHVTLPGRYLVLLPTVRHLGVSRRIEDEAERERLRGAARAARRLAAAASSCAPPARAAAPRSSRPTATTCCALWERCASAPSGSGAPTLLHQDLDLALRVVRDLFSAGLHACSGWTARRPTSASSSSSTRCSRRWCARSSSTARRRTLFERFGIDDEIEAALKSKVWLKSGGYIVINPTEALVAIDVNTGRFVGQHNLEDTVLRTNLEAVQEIVRQIRLRDLGGIIVIDLIDMIEPEHREQVFAALEAELRKDRAKNKVLVISEFGLVEITRKRSRSNLERLLHPALPATARAAAGSRSVDHDLPRPAPRAAAAARRARRAERGELLLRVHPEVARALQDEERAILDELERALGVRVLLQSDPELHHERFDVLEV